MNALAVPFDWSDLPASLRDQTCEALVLLIRMGAPLGELETVDVIDPVTRERRVAQRVPSAWLRRIDRAARVGAFERMTPAAVADRILSTPEAGLAPENETSPAGRPATMEA